MESEERRGEERARGKSGEQGGDVRRETRTRYSSSSSIIETCVAWDVPLLLLLMVMPIRLLSVITKPL